MDEKFSNEKSFALGPNYTQLEKLGQGTFGSVYKALKDDTQIVAVKVIKLDVETEGIPATALREIAILKKMNFPHIVKIIDLAITDKKIEICLEYCKSDLKKFISTFKDKSKVYNTQTIKLILFQILRATEFLHSKKILHRDLKPQNILIDDVTLEVKVADFGLSRVYSVPVRSYTKEVLTLWYKAPELLLGTSEYSAGVDIWSIGCIFGELYTKKPLFQCDSEMEMISKVFSAVGEPMIDFPEIEERKLKFAKMTGMGIEKFISDKCDGVLIEELGLDLLSRMLTCNPSRRITAREALTHVKYLLIYLSLILMILYANEELCY